MNNYSEVRFFESFEIGPDFRHDYAVLRCSFCELGEGQVAHLFEGRRGFICNECVQVCLQLLADYREMGRPATAKTPWYRRLLTGNSVLASCDFCGIAYQASERLLAGHGVQICERCVRTCESIGVEDF
ncbi:MAG TPA: ClpX C4-type zinc finger protein [Blastocatellia bacterium]|nr:ClpX C4-type zinc finger protein [Blastocatellia bacterium]